MSEEKKKDKYGNFLMSYYHIFQVKFEDKKFNLTDKMVLLVIHNLDNSERHCYATNKYIAEILGIAESSVSNSIGRLEDLKLIDREGLGKNRVLFSKLPLPQPLKINEDDDQPLKIKEDNNKEQPLKNMDNLLDSKKQPLKNQGQPLKITPQPLRSSDIIYKDKTIIKKGKDNIKKDLSSGMTPDVTSSNSISKSSSPNKKGEKIYSKDSLSYLLSEYLLILTLERWPKFDYTRLQKKEYREKKLQTGARAIDLMIRIDKRPSKEIEEVIEWALNDDFWWRNILSGDKLRKQYDKLLIAMGKVGTRKTEEVKLLDDPNPQLTAKFEKAHRKFTGRRWEPTNTERNKLIEATITFVDRVPNSSQEWIQDEIIGSLTDVLAQYYSDRSKPVLPGCWGSNFTWDTLLAQAFRNGGIPDVKFYDFRDKKPSDSEFEKFTPSKQPKPIESDLPSGF